VNETKKVLSVEEAGKLLGLGRSAAYAAVNRGQIPTLRFGRKLVVPVAELERLVGERSGQ
jgi:excisionase family DNA binding protein